jgi:hypothetical protein
MKSFVFITTLNTYIRVYLFIAMYIIIKQWNFWIPLFPGFIKFLEPYYMILITKRRFLGNVNGHSIYGIGDSKMLCLSHPSFQTTVASSRAENRLGCITNKILPHNRCMTQVLSILQLNTELSSYILGLVGWYNSTGFMKPLFTTERVETNTKILMSNLLVFFLCWLPQ